MILGNWHFGVACDRVQLGKTLTRPLGQASIAISKFVALHRCALCTCGALYLNALSGRGSRFVARYAKPLGRQDPGAEAKLNRAGAKPAVVTSLPRVAAPDFGSHGFEPEFEGALANAAEGFFVHI